jgi:hypothetical protein
LRVRLCCAPGLLLLAGSPLTLSDQLVAAVGASCAVSLVATPTELLKCRLQAQGCSATARQRLVEAGLDPSKHAIYRTPMGMYDTGVAKWGQGRGMQAGMAHTVCVCGMQPTQKHQTTTSLQQP